MKRNASLLIGSGAALALAAAHVSPTIALTASGRRLLPVITNVDGADGVALTFDDGPDRSTDVFLKILADAHARATFFVVGEQVERYPNVVKEMLAAGHEIGIHGYAHRHHLLLTPWQVADELERAQATIEEATGRAATLFRPPHGIFSLASWFAVGRLDWRRVLWSRWGKDWRAEATCESILKSIGQPVAGDIVLLHDSDRYASPGSWRKTVEALPEIILRAQARGLPLVTVSSLLNRD